MFNGSLFAENALLPQGWRKNVVIRWDILGNLIEVKSDSIQESGIPTARGPVIAGMPNLHSHAFQRAMAGLTETLGDPNDSFWSWRTLMYRFAQHLQPKHLAAISRHLYIEMLKSGYTSVCEFHYLHNAPGGTPYDNPAELAEQIIVAAREVGIGMTLLPVLYQYSGFGGLAPMPHQSRFISSPEWLLDMRSNLKKTHPEDGMRRYGIAPHSLRAVDSKGLTELVSGLTAEDSSAPIHIHIAEQEGEVSACIESTGRRPVELLFENHDVNERWCLVHATHMNAGEYRDVASSGAIVGLCPTTEANLGDGIFDARTYLADSGQWGIGSDSNICINPRSEIRMLEYGQRLQHRRRNVLADKTAPVVADRLYQAAVSGGAAAAGLNVAGITVGQRADLVVMNSDNSNFCGNSQSHLLSSFIFCEHSENQIRDVYVGGHLTISEGHHALEDQARYEYRLTLDELLKEEK
jgi:formimidoylglutamate deiminase